MDGCLHEWMANTWMEGGWMDQMGEWLNGWMDGGWMIRWLDG